MENKNNQINVFDVAQFFVKKDQSINKTKIQKLLYYAQGYYLAKYNKVLFQESIEAWPYGPVIPAVYAETLKQEFQKQNFQLSSVSFDFSSKMTNLPLTDEQEKILYQVFKDFGHMSASQLSEQTHNESPWKDTYNTNKLYSNCPIPSAVLYSFFRNKKNNI
ncbi:MAG: Panacea domain-containing protein [Candidatus Phytoplasma vitis]|nr:MAG: DUF4065 domain-containing protein [Candidatus Phytoplasma vitis]